MRNISQPKIMATPLALAPQDEQRQIGIIIRSLSKSVEVIEGTIQQVRQQLDNLEQSILAQAFRGELVPQDPSDEPASVLLERIRQSREDAPPRKTQRRKKE